MPSTQNFQEDLKRRLSSRKFQVTVIGFITSTVLVVQGILPPGEYVEFLKWLFTAYVAGNVGEHLTKTPSVQATFSQNQNES